VNQDHVSALLALGYECLKNTDLESAAKFFDEALHEDFERGEVLYALKCCNFWREPAREADLMEDAFARGDFLVSKWRTFKSFLTRISGDSEMATYAFKRMVFGMALGAYLSAPDESRPKPDPEAEFRLGRCRKALGDYETALHHLEKAVAAKRDSGKYLAELADCLALSGEQRLSKLRFREAFFLSPEAVELDYLESDMIRILVDAVKEKGRETAALKEWIPVYGELTGLFDAKQELSPSEIARLNSSMFQLENELRENPLQAEALKPRLLNRYFWLADYYETIGAENARIERILLKIRLLDEDIFQQYAS
jgi:tetratricopeptide (TPR) repeat protein